MLHAPVLDVDPGLATMADDIYNLNHLIQILDSPSSGRTTARHP